jgi:putative toxin-antitoxin system antitoxin component (TIGR02293 family)
MMKNSIEISENQMSYQAIDDRDVLSLIQAVRKGIKYAFFTKITEKSPFTLPEWAQFLHLTNRTMQRYKSEDKTFDAIYAEKIVEITMLYKYGVEVFGNEQKLNIWLETDSIVLGGVKPKSLLDSVFGINLIKDELTRIEHGILA